MTNKEEDFFKKLQKDTAKYGRAEAVYRSSNHWLAYEELYGESREDFDD